MENTEECWGELSHRSAVKLGCDTAIPAPRPLWAPISHRIESRPLSSWWHSPSTLSSFPGHAPSSLLPSPASTKHRALIPGPHRVLAGLWASALLFSPWQTDPPFRALISCYLHQNAFADALAESQSLFCAARRPQSNLYHITEFLKKLF